MLELKGASLRQSEAHLQSVLARKNEYLRDQQRKISFFTKNLQETSVKIFSTKSLLLNPTETLLRIRSHQSLMERKKGKLEEFHRLLQRHTFEADTIRREISDIQYQEKFVEEKILTQHRKAGLREEEAVESEVFDLAVHPQRSFSLSPFSRERKGIKEDEERFAGRDKEDNRDRGFFSPLRGASPSALDPSTLRPIATPSQLPFSQLNQPILEQESQLNFLTLENEMQSGEMGTVSIFSDLRGEVEVQILPQSFSTTARLKNEQKELLESLLQKGFVVREVAIRRQKRI